MKAIVLTNYGSHDFFELQEVAKPTPKNNEVLRRRKCQRKGSHNFGTLGQHF